MTKTTKRKGLGRGLDALLAAGVKPTGELSDGAVIDSANMPVAAAGPKDGRLLDLPVEFLQRGKYQPRRDMHEEAL